MSVEFDRAKRLVKRAARYTAVPTVFSFALLASGCGDAVGKTNFPPCSEDPQPKIQRIKVADAGFWDSELREHIAQIDGVEFRLREESPRRVDIKAEENRVMFIDPGKVEFKGLEDGREYIVTFPAEIVGTVITIDVVATCSNTEGIPR